MCVCVCEWCTLPWPAAPTVVPGAAAVGFDDDEMVLGVFSSVSLLNDAHRSSILDFSFSSWEVSPPASPPSQASPSPPASPPSQASPDSPASPPTSTGLLSCLVERCGLLCLLRKIYSSKSLSLSFLTSINIL